jgi:hypothetical protein
MDPVGKPLRIRLRVMKRLGKDVADHKATAIAHEAAAQLHTKGDHAAALDHSREAKGCGDTAHKSSTDVHGQSTMQAKI